MGFWPQTVYAFPHSFNKYLKFQKLCEVFIEKKKHVVYECEDKMDQYVIS